MSDRVKYIAVHGGAGSHPHDPGQERNIKQALRLACEGALREWDGIETLETSSRRSEVEDITSLDMVVDSITVLENDPSLNAGYGSNLTLFGTVECDAALMDGHLGDFGSVGAVSGVKNPIQLARAVLENSKIPDPLGRVPPLTLVSEGARSFALSNKVWRAIEAVEPDSLISTRARDNWSKWMTRLETSRSTDGRTDFLDAGNIQDTVGAVAYRTTGAAAAGVSSGGILLKHPGRVGEAATFGAGCWAQHFSRVGISVACSVSGTGEYICRTALARVIMDAFRFEIERSTDVDCHDILQRVLLDDFCAPSRERGVNNPQVGVLLIMAQETPPSKPTVRLFCAFTTPSMAIAYASSKNPMPKVQILRQSRTAGSWGLHEPRIFITAVTMLG